eukprot:TRINITY_DN9339_c0_g1_i1.p1 TRINITY_DN9339_c0_g1~~TRINITY_DN9339_c0_g1_i1.p1  ORF type:complete len:327 (-),score=57.15 TRINITY_DN9339_c0_g1_i1:22-1002(-)
MPRGRFRSSRSRSKRGGGGGGGGGSYRDGRRSPREWRRGGGGRQQPPRGPRRSRSRRSPSRKRERSQQRTASKRSQSRGRERSQRRTANRRYDSRPRCGRAASVSPRTLHRGGREGGNGARRMSPAAYRRNAKAAREEALDRIDRGRRTDDPPTGNRRDSRRESPRKDRPERRPKASRSPRGRSRSDSQDSEGDSCSGDNSRSSSCVFVEKSGDGKEIEAETPKASAPPPEHAKLGIKELKELLTAAGVSFMGATEKEDLVRLLTKARAQAALGENQFEATKEWQKVPDGAALQTGLEVKFDLAKGCNYARIPMARQDNPCRGGAD